MTAGNEKQAQIMGMITHLLAKTTANGATVQEAAAAAAKVQELTFKYNLDLAAIAKQGRDKTGNYVNKTTDLGSAHTWKRELFYAICNVNFGRGLVWVGTRKATIVAEDHNVQIIEHLYTYLSREIMRLANAAWLRETDGRRYTTSAEGESEGKFKDRFGRGAIVAIMTRLYQQHAQDKTASSDSTALVVVKDAETKAAVEKFYPNSKDGSKNMGVRFTDGASWSQGVRAGQAVPLNAPLTAGAK